MDGPRFDDFTRAISVARSRRRVLQSLAVGAAGGLLGLGGGRRARAAQPDKQPLCHVTGDPANPYVVIEVAEPAWETHFAHGDSPYTDCCIDADCQARDACESVVGCSDGQCAYAPISCDDGNACTADTCDPALGCVHTPISCDDGDACTESICDPELGCVHTPIISCPVCQTCSNGDCVPEPDYTPCEDGGNVCLSGECVIS